MASVAEVFERFSNSIRMSDDTVKRISEIRNKIDLALNRVIYKSPYNYSRSFYTGSYGRGTEIYTSDIDLVVVLPNSLYEQYTGYFYNGQSSLLQKVRETIATEFSSYSYDISGDGQVVVLKEKYGNIRFEIVPSFDLNGSGELTYPDSNDGGRWRKMNPKAEIDAFDKMNQETNKNLKRLCRMLRVWNSSNNIGMKGILIDTMAYHFLKDYQYKDKSYLYYDYMSRDFFKYFYDSYSRSYWYAPGSNWQVRKDESFRNKAYSAYNNCLGAISYEKTQSDYQYYNEWRKVYGERFVKAQGWY